MGIMDGSENQIVTISPPAMEGRFSWFGLLVAIVVAPLFGLVWAWVAEVAQFYSAPIVLFPLLVGVFAGLSVVALVRFAQIGHRPTIVLAALLTAGVAGVGQHYFGYLAAYRPNDSATSTGLATGADFSALLRDLRPSFGEYIQAQAKRGRPLWGKYVAEGWLAWLSWSVDVLLEAVGAVAVIVPAVRVPYCNQCATWYRTIRGGKIDRSSAQRLAELIGVEGVGLPRSPRYRLSACHGGCGPTRCELSWEESGGAVDLVQVWLDSAGRNQVVAILDSQIPNSQSLSSDS
jgi:hypothetical protein